MKYGVFIGRFQPFHNGHLSVVIDALSKVDKLIIAIGSANAARNVKNPWSAQEREDMITNALVGNHVSDAGLAGSQVQFVHLNDFTYNDNAWVSQVQNKVDEATGGSEDVTLFGRDKDRSTYYLSLFPQWKLSPAKSVALITATEIRELYFHCDLAGLEKWVSTPVLNYLRGSMMATVVSPTPTFLSIKDEFEQVAKYKAAWKGAPYPPTFVTTDAVVIKSGHVLVVRRKCQPGKGLLALPGGFLNQNERVLEGCLRELKEETRIDVPLDTLRTSVVANRVFDDPDRSLRGRTITHAFCIDLGSGKLPRVKGSDDAEKALWIPISEVSSRGNEFYEDHSSIVQFFQNRF